MAENEPSVGLKALRGINGTIKWIILIFVVLLTNGSFFNGGFWLSYPARGTFSSFKIKDGRSIKFHYLCDGPKDPNKPTFMFEADGSHGMLDFLGNQYWLKKAGRRSCIWDKPGLGYSDSLYYNQWDLIKFNNYYVDFISAMNEPGPYIMVGWGGGGSLVYNYAIKQPSKVRALVYLDVYPDGFEFMSQKLYYKWDDNYYKDFTTKDINSRFGLFGLINGLAVPWGIMNFVMYDPPSKSYPKEYRDERLWYFLNERTWITQKMFLYNYTIFPEKQEPLNQNIPLHHIFTAYTDDILTQQCKDQNLNKDKCDLKFFSNKYAVESKEEMTKQTQGGKIIKCTSKDCDLGSYTLTDPKYTVDRLIELFP